MFSVKKLRKVFACAWVKPVKKYFRSSFFSLKRKEAKLCDAYFNFLQNTKTSINQFIFESKKQIKEGIVKELTILKDTKYSITFKPLFAVQGACVLAITLFIAITVTTTIIPQPKIQTAQLINHQSITTKQVNAVVAGLSNNVSWTKLIKKSDITKTNNKLLLPKHASNIKVSTISNQQALAILNTTPTSSLTTEDRKTLAHQGTPWLAAITQPTVLFNKLSIITKYLYADLSDAVDSVVQPEADETPTEEIQNNTVVDLSAEVSAPVVEEKPKNEEKEEKETEKEVKQEEKKETKEEKTETAGGTSDIPPAQEPVPEEFAQTRVSELPASVPAVEPVIESAPEPEPTTPEPADTYVAVTYDTPAPTITEKETTTGKTVTVSSNETEKVDCESLNPHRSTTDPSVVLSPAGLLNGLKNIFASITKFFTADLEQAVTDIIETITDKKDKQEEKEDKEIKEEAKEEKKQDEAPAETPAVEETPVLSSNDQNPTLSSNDQNAEISARSDLAQSSEQEYQDCLAQQATITNVLAHTNIPEIYKVGQEDKIKIKWLNNPDCGAIEDPRQAEACRDNGSMPFKAYDLNGNGRLDYVEWTVPHLSDQVFEIIFISKAWHLDSNKEILEDIYDTVATQDQIYATVPNGEYVRVTFEQILDSTKDITMYMKPTAGSVPVQIEVYPVYTGADGIQTQGTKLDLVNDGQNPDFTNIDHDGKYRILLQNLQTPTDVFDLKIVQ